MKNIFIGISMLRVGILPVVSADTATTGVE